MRVTFDLVSKTVVGEVGLERPVPDQADPLPCACWERLFPTPVDVEHLQTSPEAQDPTETPTD